MKTTPKDFFFWAGAMIALYVSVFSFVTLMFEYINRAFPDPLEYYVDPYSGIIRFAIASLAVLFPVLLILMNLIRRDIALIPEKAGLWVRRWALHLTLFVAGATIAIDLVTLVNTYLGGDLSARFGLKVVVVLLIALAIFMHFLADLRGYWISFPKKARMVGFGAGILVLITIISSFFVMGTPGQVRLYRFDDQKVSDLQNIQWQVVNYWQQKEALPTSLSDLADPISGYVIPVDPQSAAQYGYELTGALSFKLCATFNAASQQSASNPTSARVVEAPYGKGDMSDSWSHEAGETCFERTIDPERYPPYSNTKGI